MDKTPLETLIELKEEKAHLLRLSYLYGLKDARKNALIHTERLIEETEILILKNTLPATI